ncbi:hypothetical protein C5688_00010 [Methylocystis sp. MitZ-2018]|nr:hypothetical protein C5688_00010 [Methylocystis sp. MitZ-2018]
MSAKLVKEEIAKFLGREDAEVLCIRGKWGVGKTYTWSKQLEAAQAAKTIKLPRYSYVSLFGINSLDELKFAIFENVITLSEGLKKADLQTLDAFISKLGSWRQLTKIAQSFQVVRRVVGTDTTLLVSFMTIRDQVICIDDLERRGQKLDVNDVLGLISYLREQRNCKVALILNDEQLEGDSKRSFEKNLEKVVDVSLVYEPPSADSVNIAITGTDDTNRQVAERCVNLGITNIRVIKRVWRFVEAIKPLLSDYDEEVFKAAVASIVLFSWSHDQPEDAPPLTFLRNKNQQTFGLDRQEVSPPNEAAWNTLLDAYGYMWTDDFDLVLMEGVCDGYFDPERTRKAAQAVHEKVLATKADGSFEQAWRPYHDSFGNNQSEVLDSLYASFMKNFKYISPNNLNGTVSLFKELGRPEQAKTMLDHYLANRKEDRKFFDLAENVFSDTIDDPDVRAAFNEKAAQIEENRDIPAIILSIKDTWDDDRLKALAATPIDEYRKSFKTYSGPELRQMLANVFQFDRIANSSAEMKEISRRAREALKLIGAESPINARRVRRFGVKVEQAGHTAEDVPGAN